MTTKTYELPVEIGRLLEVEESLVDLDEVSRAEQNVAAMVAGYDEEEFRHMAVRRQILGMAKGIKTLESNDRLLQEHVHSIEERRLRLAYRIAWFKSQIKQLFDTLPEDETREKDPFISVWTAGSGTVIEIDDADLVPAEYKRAIWKGPADKLPLELRDEAELEINKAKALEDLKENGTIPEGLSADTERRHVVVR